MKREEGTEDFDKNKDCKMIENIKMTPKRVIFIF